MGMHEYGRGSVSPLGRLSTGALCWYETPHPNVRGMLSLCDGKPESTAWVTRPASRS